ncbi:TPA: hypothetical protein DCZ39_08795 [Patescibacteria group bacterium]|nr:hypothetical protein [Candidatus Gracilibacteria bacterium]
MLSQQIISITDLRTNTTKVLNSLGVKYIFVNNKPKSVIMDIKKYESIKRKLRRYIMDEEVAHAEKN